MSNIVILMVYFSICRFGPKSNFPGHNDLSAIDNYVTYCYFVNDFLCVDLIVFTMK